MRDVYSAAFGCITVIGYIMLIVNRGPAVSYTGTFVVAAGLYAMVGLPLAWLLSNKPRYAKRALATGMQYTTGNTAGIVMPWLFKSANGPHFYTGYGVSIVATAVGKEDWKLKNKTEEEIGELGDWSPRYISCI
ncbi:hypothetical protein BDW69DRAFT_186640 [Aspergillus filifer]